MSYSTGAWLLLTTARCQPACTAADAWHLPGLWRPALCRVPHPLTGPDFCGPLLTAHSLTAAAPADACHLPGHGGGLGGGGSGELASGDV